MMKLPRIFLTSFLFLIVLVVFIHGSALAHPGNVSYDGCHYCWSNCSSWGFTYGTRHNPNNLADTCSCNSPVDTLYCHPQVIQTNIVNSPTFTPSPIPTLAPTETPTDT